MQQIIYTMVKHASGLKENFVTYVKTQTGEIRSAFRKAQKGLFRSYSSVRRRSTMVWRMALRQVMSGMVSPSKTNTGSSKAKGRSVKR